MISSPPGAGQSIAFLYPVNIIPHLPVFDQNNKTGPQKEAGSIIEEQKLKPVGL